MNKIEDEGRQRTIEKLLHGLSWYSHQELIRVQATQGRNGSDQISKWLSERQIFCVKHDVVLYPQFQFDDAYSPRSVIQEVLACFGSKEAWAIAAWFYFPNGWIEKLMNGKVVAAAPLEILSDRETLLDAARKEQYGTHFA